MKILYKAISWLITILFPIALTFLGIRLLLTHIFPEIEYRMPGFPEDEYGFTIQDRLKWSKISIDYLLNDAGIYFLGDMTFPDGSPLFSGRELSHMQDVKNVVQPVFWVGYIVWFFILGTGLWARFGTWWLEYVKGIRRGGWLTAGLAGIIGILAATSFWQFFTVFHGLFFTGDSWQFLFSDSLIRLFPMRLWQDVFLFTGAIDFLGGLALGLCLYPKRK